MADGDTSKILESIKAMLGLQPAYAPFDVELLIHINSVVATLNQLGVGPGYDSTDEVLKVTDTTTWAELLLDDKSEDAKSYMFLRVKMLFDSSTMQPALVSAYEKMIQELEWRLSVSSDPMIPQPYPTSIEEDPIILDPGEL